MTFISRHSYRRTTATPIDTSSCYEVPMNRAHLGDIAVLICSG